MKYYNIFFGGCLITGVVLYSLYAEAQQSKRITCKPTGQIVELLKERYNEVLLFGGYHKLSGLSKFSTELYYNNSTKTFSIVQHYSDKGKSCSVSFGYKGEIQ